MKTEEEQRVFRDTKKELELQNSTLTGQVEDLKEFGVNKDRLDAEKNDLQTRLEEAIKLRNEESNAKEVEKMDAVEKLRKQMLY